MTGMSPRPPKLEEFVNAIRARTLRVGVIGLGYVGLPLVLLFEENGFPVLGFDVDASKTEMLNRGESYIRHIGVNRIRKAFTTENVLATTDFQRLAECDAVIVCVPTPLGPHREPDLKYIRMTAETIVTQLRPGQLVVLAASSAAAAATASATGSRRCGSVLQRFVVVFVDDDR